MAGIDVIPGDSQAHTVVDLSYEDWCSFAWELRSCFALFYADRLAFSRGGFGSLARWEPALRVAFDGQPIYDLDDPPEVTDASGAPLDLSRRFSLDDLCNRAGEAADFLARAGFLHLSGVVDRGELERISADVTEAVLTRQARGQTFVVDDGRRRGHLQPRQLPERPVQFHRWSRR